MSVVARVTVTPSRIEAFLRLVEHDGGNSLANSIRDRLLVQSLASGGVTNFSTADVVAEARALGLIAGTDQMVKLLLPDASRGTLIGRLETILLSPKPAREAGHEHFPFALAWMLTFEPLAPIPWTGLGILANPETGRDLEITNDDRGRQMHYWARYLGFSREFEIVGGHFFLPDPSVALQRHLDALFADEIELTAAEFMRRWADRCPVIDGGEARIQVESWMRETGHDARLPRSNTISGSSSHALNHLDRAGELRLISTGADALKLSLALPGAVSTISHIRRERSPA